LQRRAASLRNETSNLSYHTIYDSTLSLPTIIARALIRPFRMLLTQPIIQLLSAYQLLLYGVLYILFSTLPTLWTVRYHERPSIAGLNYISLGIGVWGGAQIAAPLNDRIYRALKRRNGNVGKPEFRVPLMGAGALMCPLGLFVYGWAAQAHLHWIVPNVGVLLFAAGNIISYTCSQTYILDSYTRFAASGTAAVVTLRSIAGFGFPLFAPYMYEKLDYGWGNSVLGFISIILGIPAPLVFWKYGERLRAKSQFAAG
jgi:MFS family permease